MATPTRRAHWLLKYRSEWLRPDVIAGVTAAAVVIPKAMAYATIAGLPVEAGLYAAAAPMLVYALTGSSRVLSVSTTSTLALLVGTALAAIADGGSTATPTQIVATLGLLTGAVLLVAGVFRLGFLADFISDPVLTGFKAGIGIVIIMDQLPKLFGLHPHAHGVLARLAETIGGLGGAHVPTLILAVVTFLLMIALERFVPRVPSPLVAFALGIIALVALGLDKAGVVVTGAIQAGLPQIVRPDWSLIGPLWPSALGIALMAIMETIAAGRAFARREDPQPNANQEMIAVGLANVASGLVGAIPAGGGTSQTAVNSRSGARTQMSELVTVGLTVATLLFLGPLIGLIPQVTLAAVVIEKTLPLVSPKDFMAVARVRRMEFIWTVVACLGVVFVGTLQGILIAVALSVLMLFYQASHPNVYVIGRKPGTEVFRPQTAEHPEDETFPGLLIARTEGRLSFANASQVVRGLRNLIDDNAPPSVVVLDCRAVPDIEYTALLRLIEVERKLGEAGIQLWIAALNPEALTIVRKTPLAATLGRDRMYASLALAVQSYLQKNAADIVAHQQRASATSA
jgi:high affinity sulfate transporter 1